MTEEADGSPPKIAGLTYLGPLGSGGYSDVFLYEQARPRRKVAVKVLKLSGVSDAVRRQFTAEADAMAELADHSSIVSVFSADVADDGRPYLLMAVYPKDNLGVRAARDRFAVSEVLRIGIQIASAVETAHSAGILHRDIKPANILTNQYGNVGLTDFGIAAQAAAADDDEDEVGVSVPWAPPEVLYATGPASVPSDVYSLAATLWHLLVGRAPFEATGSGDNAPLAIMGRTRDSPVPNTGRADVPDSLERLLAQAMAKDPAARPSSAVDFARSLQSVEQELHLRQTDIELVLADDPPDARRPAEPAQEDHATRIKAPVRIAGQSSPVELHSEPSSPSTHAVVPPAVTPQAPEPKTVKRLLKGSASQQGVVTDEGVADADDGTAATDADRAPGSSGGAPRGALAAAVVVAVAVVVGIGALLAGGSGDGVGNDRSTSTTQPIVDPDAIGPPGTPTVSGEVVGDALVFSWTYSNAADTDTFIWQHADGSPGGNVDEPAVRLASEGAPVCIQVKVVRADGRNAALAWSPEGCAG